jgi:hypothetical protein
MIRARSGSWRIERSVAERYASTVMVSTGRALVALSTAGLLGCATVDKVRLRPSADYGEESGRVWVRGPWEAITPAANVDDVVDQLCPAIERLDRARDGDEGVEYCGLLYSIPGKGYFASVPSPLGLRIHERSGPAKSCRIPTAVRDAGGDPQVEADYHSHPWPDAPFSDGDLSTPKQKWSYRIQFDTTCRVFKYVAYLGAPRPGEVFLRVGTSWRLQSIVRVDDKPRGKATPPLQEAR